MPTALGTAESPRLFSVIPPEDHPLKAFGQFYKQAGKYVGHLTVSDASFGPGPEMNPLPSALRSRVWKVRTEDGHFGTIFFPRTAYRSWHSTGAMTLEFDFAYFLNQVSVDYEEPVVREVIVESLAFPAMLGMRLLEYEHKFGDAVGTATFALPAPLSWRTTDFRLEIAAINWPSVGKDWSEVAFRSVPQLRLAYDEPRGFAEVFEHLRSLDDLVSVVVGKYVRPDRVFLNIDVPGAEDRSVFALQGHGSTFDEAKDISWKLSFAHISRDSNWATLFESFLKHRAANLTAFKWFRTSQTNQRFVEENFLYCVRLIDRYFRQASTLPNPSVEGFLRVLSQRADEGAMREFVESFLRSKSAPAPSLTDTVSRLYARFPEILAFGEIAANQVTKLRNRETHGANTNYTADEYGEMVALTRGFLIAFRIAVLEACGLPRAALFSDLRRGTYARYLNDG